MWTEVEGLGRTELTSEQPSDTPQILIHLKVPVIYLEMHDFLNFIFLKKSFQLERGWLFSVFISEQSTLTAAFINSRPWSTVIMFCDVGMLGYLYFVNFKFYHYKFKSVSSCTVCRFKLYLVKILGERIALKVFRIGLWKV